MEHKYGKSTENIQETYGNTIKQLGKQQEKQKKKTIGEKI